MRRHGRNLAVPLVVAAAAIALGANASAAPLRAEAAKAKSVNVTAGKPMELRFRLSSRSAPKGVVVFRVKNQGALVHDFKIKGKVTRRLSAGQTATLRVRFAKAGRFQFLCTVPGHAAGGMKGTFRIR